MSQRWDSFFAGATLVAAILVGGPLLREADSRGAYVYRLDREDALLELTAWRGLLPTGAPSYSMYVDSRASRWYCGLATNTAVEKGAWQDWRYRSLPEFVQNRFESTVSIPLLDEERLLGLANFCREQANQYNVGEIDFLAGLRLPLGSILAKGRLASQVEKLTQQLADRKVLDRAKGILQSRFGWTEEEAYLHLRRTSRQTREPMRHIAELIIRNSGQPSSWQEERLRA